ncbi:hypothetical protein COCVIDRAFT_116848 [Bipolaris victoriae FI3]|uniref:Uncharacterized protein n=1 Tax=Bipolaris victoriae (strain FI3) TaxID=930091 RepID=W7DWS2_BIPV3|nr:hypothetical protein COCVIDRAFT_116848 [Bipolaris victoriae FI3]
MPLSDTTADTNPSSLACAVTGTGAEPALSERAARTEIPSRSYPKGRSARYTIE